MEHTVKAESAAANETISKGAAVVQQIQAGKVPANELLTETLSAAQTTISEQEREIQSIYGRRAASDMKEVLSTAQQFLEEKNYDDMLQRLIKHVKMAAEEAQQMASQAASEVKSDMQQIATAGKGDLNDFKKQGRNISEALQHLAMTLVNSREFRLLLIDIIDLVQNTVDYALDCIKAAHPEQVLTPVNRLLSEAQAGVESAQDPNKPVTTGRIEAGTEHAKNATSSAMDETAERAKQVASDIARNAQAGTPVDEAKKREIIARFNALWRRVVNSSDFRQAISALLDMWDEAKSRLATLAEYARAQASGAELPKLRSADLVWLDVREIIGRWVGREQLDDFLQDFQEYMQLISKDAQVNRLFADVRNFINETIQNPQLLQSDSQQNKMTQLFNRAVDEFHRWEYNNETDYVLYEARTLLESIKRDSTSLKLQEATEKLGKDLILDERGNVNFRVTQDVLASVKQLMLPLFLDQFAVVPLPRIESSDDTYDFAFDNLVFPGRQLIPEHFQFKAKEDIRLDTTSSSTAGMTVDARLKLFISSVQMHINNIKFQVRRKGLISISDEGTANLSIGGPDSSMCIRWEVRTDTEKRSSFQTRDVRVKIDRMKIDIIEAHHSVLLPAITTLFNGTIKQKIEQQLTDMINEQLVNFNVKLNQLAVEASQKQQQFTESLTQRAQEAAQKAYQGAQVVAEQARETTSQMLEQAKTVMSDLSEKAAATAKDASRKFVREGKTLTDRAKQAVDAVTNLATSKGAPNAQFPEGEAVKGPCGKCGKEADKHCARCNTAFYCSKECQIADWRKHRLTCRIVSATATTASDHGTSAPAVSAAKKIEHTPIMPASHFSAS